MSTNDMSELVTRAILKEEFKHFKAELKAELREELREELSEELSRYATREELKEALKNHPTHDQLAKILDDRFERFGNRFRDDMQSAMNMLLGDFQRSLALALEPSKDLPGRVTKLEDLPDRVTTLELLPDRVTKLEAKVFPPKRTSRRR